MNGTPIVEASERSAFGRESERFETGLPGCLQRAKEYDKTVRRWRSNGIRFGSHMGRLQFSGCSCSNCEGLRKVLTRHILTAVTGCEEGAGLIDLWPREKRRLSGLSVGGTKQKHSVAPLMRSHTQDGCR